MAEVIGLAKAAGADVVVTAVQERQSADPATLIGRGKAEALAHACDEADVALVIVDNDLSPAQTRNLEAICKRRVIDRTGPHPRHLRARARGRAKGNCRSSSRSFSTCCPGSPDPARRCRDWVAVSGRADLAKRSSKPIAVESGIASPR